MCRPTVKRTFTYIHLLLTYIYLSCLVTIFSSNKVFSEISLGYKTKLALNFFCNAGQFIFECRVLTLISEGLPHFSIAQPEMSFMKKLQTNRVLLYSNAMEPLVVEEVERQLEYLPPKLVEYLNPAQVVAYALNRLPALYATSEEGWHRQQQRAREQFGNQLVVAVRQGLAAVQRDPLRAATPLKRQVNIERVVPNSSVALIDPP